MNEIIPRYTAQQMEQVYNAACEDIRNGYTLLERATKALEATFGDYTGYGDLSAYHVDPYDYPSKGTIPERVINKIKKSVWWKIISILEVDKISSQKRYKEIQEQIKSNDLPEVTIANIYDILQAFVQNQNEIAAELMKEVFDVLYPRHTYYNKPQYKTNQKHLKGGDKVILSWYWVEHQWSGGFRVNYDRQELLLRIDRAFALLDGAGIPDGYRGPLVDAIQTSKNGKGETDYFEFKCFQNGNLHLKCKRLDLLAELCRIANEQSLN